MCWNQTSATLFCKIANMQQNKSLDSGAAGIGDLEDIRSAVDPLLVACYMCKVSQRIC